MIQAPPRVRTVVSASQEWLDSGHDKNQAASSVINFYEGSIERFVQTERQQYALGGLQQRRTQASFPGLQIDYTRNTGHEDIIFTVVPESFPEEAEEAQSPPDFDYDGYIVYAFQLDTPSPTFSKVGTDCDFFLNDILLGSLTMKPSDGNVQLVVFTFGDTALRCHSLNDATNPNAKIIPPGLTNKIDPPRPKIAAHTGPSFDAGGGLIFPGNPIPEHDDLPAYFVFNWNDPLNTGFGGAGSSEGPVTIVKTFAFPDLKNSSLNKTGANVFKVHVHQTAITNPTVYYVWYPSQTVIVNFVRGRPVFGPYGFPDFASAFAAAEAALPFFNGPFSGGPTFGPEFPLMLTNYHFDTWPKNFVDWGDPADAEAYLDFINAGYPGSFGVSGAFALAQLTSTPGATSLTSLIQSDQLSAEFYSRTKNRKVRMSWRRSSQSPDILVNDKPLYFLNDKLRFGDAVEFPTLNFDLSNKQDDPTAADIGA